jgi:hypothetical protein
MSRRMAQRVAQYPLPQEVEYCLDNALRGDHVYHLRETDGSKVTLFVTTAIENEDKGRLAVGIESQLVEEEFETFAWAWWTKEVEKGTFPITPEGAMDFIYLSPNEKREK